MYVITSEQRARSQCFDTYVGQTLALLHHPDVVAALGTSLLGTQILGQMSHILRFPILPNIGHGIVGLPKSKANSEGFVVMPLLPDDVRSSIQVSPELAGPTAARREKVIHFLRDQGAAANPEAIAHQAFTSCATGVIIAAAERGEALARVINWGEKVPFSTITGNTQSVCVQTRPLTLVDADLIGREAPSIVGATGLHELVHYIDYEGLPVSRAPGTEDSVFTEGRAYYSGHVALGAIGAPEPDAWLSPELLRQRYATTVNPFPREGAYLRAMIEGGHA